MNNLSPDDVLSEARTLYDWWSSLPTDEKRSALALPDRKMKGPAADAKEVGVRNPAEETICPPDLNPMLPV